MLVIKASVEVELSKEYPGGQVPKLETERRFREFNFPKWSVHRAYR